MRAHGTAFARLVAVLTMLAAPAQAQQAEPAAEQPAGSNVDRAPARLPDPIIGAPAPPAPADAHDLLFHMVSASFITAASTDLSVSMYQIGRGAGREVAFGAAWQQSPVTFALTKSVLAAGFVYGLRHVHKSRPKTALALGLAAVAVEGWLTIRSARINGP